MTVQALRRGRPEVLAELLDRYGRDMQAVAYLIVRDRATGERWSTRTRSDPRQDRDHSGRPSGLGEPVAGKPRFGGGVELPCL